MIMLFYKVYNPFVMLANEAYDSILWFEIANILELNLSIDINIRKLRMLIFHKHRIIQFFKEDFLLVVTPYYKIIKKYDIWNIKARLLINYYVK
ncbi:MULTISPECIES: hypothetical protein [unclassified Clostridium]|uniref:hypothetical protein n=1 Tax=unclassified Clostridium TaxID=2614128 RepID=UPI000297880A|nr:MULTISPECIES: hypothetical protein [unclassified Clostridium]EKQ57052.1 MAG: hypothetical protein A370_01360 [Clostridium sp. Maddingley MBC34-26]